MEEAPPDEVPEAVIDLGEAGQAQALEDVQDLDAVPLVVEEDVEDRAAASHLLAEVIGVGVIKAILVPDLAGDGREGRRGSLELVDQRRQGALIPFDRRGAGRTSPPSISRC